MPPEGDTGIKPGLGNSVPADRVGHLGRRNVLQIVLWSRLGVNMEIVSPQFRGRVTVTKSAGEVARIRTSCAAAKSAGEVARVRPGSLTLSPGAKIRAKSAPYNLL